MSILTRSLIFFVVIASLVACGGGGGNRGNNSGNNGGGTPNDTTPNTFNFTDQTDVNLLTVISSNIITVSGIDAPANISVAGGEYQINGGGFVSTLGTVTNGQQVVVRQTSSNQFSTMTDAVLTIGGVSDTFSVTTLAEDLDPDAFTFTDQTDVTLNSVSTSNAVTIVGINSTSPVSISGGEYSIDGGTFTNVAGTVNNNQQIVVRQTSSNQFSATTNVTLTVGGISDIFSVTTIAEDLEPDAFTFIDQTNVPLNMLITSNTITITSINNATPISISAGGEYSVDGGAFTSSDATINNNQQVEVRRTSSSNFSTTTIAILTVGNVNDSFELTTLATPPLSPPLLVDLPSQTYTLNTAITTLEFFNTGGGSLSSCTADTLPTGLSVNISSDSSTCEITGTPTALQSATTHTITAFNAAGSDSASIVIEVRDDASSFVTIWKTDNPGASANNQIKIGTLGGGYNYTVDWGDGSSDVNVSGDLTHTYASAGTYTVSIAGDFPQIYFSDAGYDNEKLLSVEQWGNNLWQSMHRAFYGCSYVVLNATDVPDLSQVTDMSYMFYRAYAFNQDLSSWDVSSVIDMNSIFFAAYAFNQDISNWDVSSVTNMRRMFYDADAFNQDLSSWDVSSVTNMESMFAGTNTFNQGLSNWDVSSVINMAGMFSGARAFNQDLSIWDVSALTDMSYMFSQTVVFNQDLSNWDVSSVIDMEGMFSRSVAFNQDLSNWDVSSVIDMGQMFFRANNFNQALNWSDVSSVTSMYQMFYEAEAFNQPLNNWDVSSVTNMAQMFYGATAFNQSLNNWDVSLVISMYQMFYTAFAFDQDLSSWDVSSVNNMNAMFYYALAFNQDLSSWDVSSVINMGYMFYRAASFNQALNGWDTSSVVIMNSMFDGADTFNQSLSNWNVSSVINMTNMFAGAVSFNQDLSSWDVSSVTGMGGMFANGNLSTANYNALLMGWSAQSLQNNVVFDGGNSTYSSSFQIYRDVLTGTYNWTITDGGVSGNASDPGSSFIKLSNAGEQLEDNASVWSCVLDESSGLVWEVKKASGLGDVSDVYTRYISNGINDGSLPGLMDSTSDCDAGVNCNTEAYIARINGIQLCGYSDWRLPTVPEFLGIANYTEEPVISSEYFPLLSLNLGSSIFSYYHTSTASGSGVKGYNPRWGIVDTLSIGYTAHSLLVRGNTSHIEAATAGCDTPINSFVYQPDSKFLDNLDGTVSDTNTGLMWQKCLDGIGGNDCSIGTHNYGGYDAALQAGSASEFAGYSDWRIPTISEVFSIYEPACGDRPYNNNLFNLYSSIGFWTSNESLYGGGDQAWAFDTGDGELHSEVKSNNNSFYFVRDF